MTMDEIAPDIAAMRRYARALARDPADADDVVQDAIVRAIESRAGFDPARSAGPGGRRRWLLAIVHNVFVSGKRRAAAEARRNDRLAEALERNPELEQEQQVRLARVAAAYAALPEQQRAVLHLIAVEGMSYRAAADVLNVPTGTIMSRLARARAALRNREGDGKMLRIVGGTHG